MHTDFGHLREILNLSQEFRAIYRTSFLFSPQYDMNKSKLEEINLFRFLASILFSSSFLAIILRINNNLNEIKRREGEQESQ